MNYQAFIAEEKLSATASTSATSSGETDSNSDQEEIITEEMEIKVGTIDER